MRINKHHIKWKYRVVLLLSIAIIVPLGYIIRFSPITGFEWLNDVFGSIAYEIFWILLFAAIAPKISAFKVALGVCIATCGLEFLQLWQPSFLQAARSTLPGRLVLGNTFVWSDFPPYFIGSFLGWVWISWLKSYIFRTSS
ncbi:MAG: DUF2809 domain-containing protein [Mastigocoleus sp. MO_167.B18]|nr:DUF2809 domain-containing protein [Mastigocoleus sp. MO_167.B18]